MPSRALSALIFSAICAVAMNARADVGHVGLTLGAAAVEEANTYEWRPVVRTEVGFRVWGPFEVGGHLQMLTLGFPVETPSFGGGLFVQLRPEVPFYGIVPHVEIAGGRTTLSTAIADRVDAWSLSVGGGVGYEFFSELSIEARVHHHWYFDLPPDSGVGVDGWTVSAGIAYGLP
jgi:hypothetical protein